MNKGKIELKREDKNFTAGFCMAKEKAEILEESSSLHSIEKKYYDTLQFERRKDSYILGRITAKKAVGEMIGEEFMCSTYIDFGIFQFPVVKSSSNMNVQVSISHCDDFGIALAFPEEHPLGVDIEKIDPCRLDTLKTVINKEELNMVFANQLLPSTGCTMIWSVKESLSKVLRTGLTMDFQLLEIKSMQKINSLYIYTFRNFSQYKAISTHIGSYACSISLAKNTAVNLDLFLDSFERLAKNT